MFFIVYIMIKFQLIYLKKNFLFNFFNEKKNTAVKKKIFICRKKFFF
jgi:hypothetical protein